MSKQQVDNILVVGPSWVGDMVMAQSLFKILKQQSPQCAIDVIAPQWSVPVLERMPEVRRGIPLNVGHGELGLKTRYQLGKSLRGKYQRAIILPRSLKAALVPFFANIPSRTGFLGEMRYALLNDIRLFDKSHLNQTVKRFVALGLTQADAQKHFQSPQPQLNINPDQQQQALQAFKLNQEKPAIALFPGAEYGPAKQWPLQHYAALAVQLLAEGFQVWVMGSQKDSVAAEEIIGTVNNNTANNEQPEHNTINNTIVNLCGNTSLAQAIDLIAFCKGAVSNDSGLMHVAAAAGCPVVGIYGSSSPLFTPPLTKRSKILHLNLSCSPCFKRECPLQHLDCLHKISPESVFNELKMLLSEQ
ncbi:MAG: lipopolysaccharide heptosyltransferase II [Cellvibrionaceae bacterium]